MKRTLWVVASALCLQLSACSGTSAAAPVRAAEDAPVALRVGESARAADGQWQFGVDKVIADSRCPKNVQCVWAGDAVVRVWWQRATGPREVRELHTAPGAGGGGPKSRLRLLRLDPWPVAGRPMEASDYVATLVVAHESETADPER